MAAPSPNYGTLPAVDEFEISIFGPGYGEAIAIHVGDGNWILVDSCVRSGGKEPESLVYLRAIGADLARVKSIVATHWHDDHVRGLSKLKAACPNAIVSIATVFNNDEARQFLAAYNGHTSSNLSKATTELYETISNSEYEFVHHKCLVYEDNSRAVRIVALTPTTGAVARFISFVAQYLPSNGTPNGTVTSP